MFIPYHILDPQPQKKKPSELETGRFIGGLILIIGLGLLFLFVVSVDASVIVPHNKEMQQAATQTAAAPYPDKTRLPSTRGEGIFKNG